MDDGRRRPLPDDWRLARPQPPCGCLRSVLRALVGRLTAWRLGPLERSVEDLLLREADLRFTSLAALAERVERLERLGAGPRLGRLEQGVAPWSNQAPSSSFPSDPFSFGAAFRGDDSALAERARWYLTRLPPSGDLLDLGCGRGAFLDACRVAGRSARGVDLDDACVADCRTRGLSVEARDAVEALEATPPASLGGVVAAHFLEHLPAARLERLLALARERLAPGGVLLAEVPNPTTLAGLVGHFVDPSHERPLHPEVLAYLLGRAGFVGVELSWLDPVPPAARLLPVPSSADRAVADAWERVARNFELLDRTVFGCLTCCCRAEAPR